MSKKDLLEAEVDSTTQNLVAKAVKDIALNNMKVLEVKSYPLNDKLTKKLKKHSFKAYTLKEVDVFNMDSHKKEGYLSINGGEIDIPLVNLTRNEEGPWIYTNKEDAIDKVKRMNELEYEAIKELQDEINASEEYMKNLIENDRF